MKLDTDSKIQHAMDYFMYYGYPNTKKINGKKYSQKNAHDITQIAIWVYMDPDYSGRTYDGFTSGMKKAVKALDLYRKRQRDRER